MREFIPLIGFSLALLGALALAAMGLLIILKRSPSASLFVEDRLEIAAIRISVASVMIISGFSLARAAIDKLLSLQ